MSDKQRLNLELGNDYVGLIDETKAATMLRTRTDVFENAILMLAWAVREVSRGRTIASVDEATNTFAELQMPSLMTVKRRAQAASPADPALNDQTSYEPRRRLPAAALAMEKFPGEDDVRSIPAVSTSAMDGRSQG